MPPGHVEEVLTASIAASARTLSPASVAASHSSFHAQRAHEVTWSARVWRSRATAAMLSSSQLRERLAGILRAQWEAEKERAEGHGALQKRLNEARVELERAEREADYETAAKLRHGEIPELERKLSETPELTSDEPNVYLSEIVDAEDLVQVYELRWLDVPISRRCETCRVLMQVYTAGAG